MAGIPKICRHLHLPAQAGSDRILSLMNRKYTVANYRNLVEKARLHMPDCDITTDLMVGFPSESAEEFNQTLDLARDVRFTNAFMFSYSVRAGTAAEKFTDDVPRGEKIDRLNRLISLQTAITKEHYNGMTGRSIEVMLYDRKEKRGKSWMRGQDNGCKRVLVSCPETQAGTILKVIPHSSSGMTLLA
jgi:tRNA-2-methylthio-N6-dimethylallyladenosine synthase